MVAPTKILSKVADYIGATQPIIDKVAEERSTFVKRATQAAGVLAHRGIINPNRVNAFVDKVAEDPNAVWEMVEKLASALPVDDMVDSVNAKVASGAKLDAFEEAYFGNSFNRSGMID